MSSTYTIRIPRDLKEKMEKTQRNGAGKSEISLKKESSKLSLQKLSNKLSQELKREKHKQTQPFLLERIENDKTNSRL